MVMINFDFSINNYIIHNGEKTFIKKFILFIEQQINDEKYFILFKEIKIGRAHV